MESTSGDAETTEACGVERRGRGSAFPGDVRDSATAVGDFMELYGEAFNDAEDEGGERGGREVEDECGKGIALFCVFLSSLLVSL